MHLAATTLDGAPLSAPIDGVFFKGRVCFGLPGGSVRARLVRRDSRVSASYTQGSFAFIEHGTAEEVPATTAIGAQLNEFIRDLNVARYGKGWIAFHDKRVREQREPDFTGSIEPRCMFAKH